MNTVAQANISVDEITTTADGITLHRSKLYRGLAKLDANLQQVEADATDHVIVFDPLTGLMEAINAPGFAEEMEHDDATAKAAALSFAGFSDWRLPDVSEAVHAVDYGNLRPAADVSLYPDMESTWYWTSQQTKWTEDEKGSSRSFWDVYMCLGLVSSDLAYGQLRARPVRRAVPAGQWLVLGQ